jgi:outer membrane protein assembly factor BamA
MKNNFHFLFIFLFNSFIYLGQNNDDCYDIKLKDTTNKTINSIYFKLIKKGYLTPQLNLKQEDKLLTLTVCQGEKYRQIFVNSKNANLDKYTPIEIGSVLENRFQQLINNGFPFANLKLDSFNFKKDKITARLNIQNGPFFQWGNLIIKGNAIINEQIIRSILNIQKEDPFNEDAFQTIENKISQLPYLSIFQKPELLFENGKVDLYIYLDSKPINNISGTVGLQQNSKTQNYYLIGDLRMKLVNQLKRGESLDFQWRRIQENTQSLKVGLNYPSLFKTNFGIDNQFNLYKKDSTFIELKNQFGIQYFTTKGFLIKANYKYLESNILNSIINKTEYGKSINFFYGLSLSKQKVDYLPAPKTGYQIFIDFSLGKRSTSRNDSLNKKLDNTLKSEYLFNKYISILKRHILKFQLSGEIYLAPFYYQNELIRFGGLLNQRGFREDELLGNLRLTQSIEYRFMIEQNSFLFAFCDISHLENHLKNRLQSNPLGFGSGLSFGTNQGIFSISYAIGKQFNNPILLKNGIIHFGYVSYF